LMSTRESSFISKTFTGIIVILTKIIKK